MIAMNRRAIIRLCPIGFILLFLFAAGRQIELPGVHYDELLSAPAAIDLIVGEVNGHYHKFGSFEFRGLTLTLMNLDYIGAVKCCLLALTMGLFGISVEVFRFTGLAIFTTGLIFMWRYAEEEFGLIAATVAMALIATDPGLMMLSRSDYGPIVTPFCLRSVLLYLAARWWRRGDALCLIGAGFFAGLGLYDKVNFVWFINAMLVIGGVAYVVDRNRPRLRLLPLALTGGAGLLASSPFWIYNIHYGWPFLRIVDRGRTMADLIADLPERTRVLLALIDGDGPARLFFSLPDRVAAPVGTTILLPLFIALTVTVVVSGVRQWQWRLLILPALMLLIALQIYATPKTIGMHHWTMIHPLPHLVAGAGFQLLWGRIARQIVVKTALVTALTIVLAVNVLIISEYQDRFRQTGGSGLWSAAIYDLASRLQRDYPQRKLLLMDWGLNHTLFFLSAGELRTTEPFWDLVGGLGHEERIKKLLREPGAVFVFNAPAGALYPEIYLEFQRVVAAIGPDRVSEEKVFDRRGIWVYSIVEVTSLNGST